MKTSNSELQDKARKLATVLDKIASSILNDLRVTKSASDFLSLERTNVGRTSTATRQSPSRAQQVSDQNALRKQQAQWANEDTPRIAASKSPNLLASSNPKRPTTKTSGDLQWFEDRFGFLRTAEPTVLSSLGVIKEAGAEQFAALSKRLLPSLEKARSAAAREAEIAYKGKRMKGLSKDLEGMVREGVRKRKYPSRPTPQSRFRDEDVW